jgi:hypothetical protein
MVYFIIAYVAVLFLYFYSETSGKMALRAPNKIILASMFLVFAVVQFESHYEFLSFHLLLMVALFLAWMGDVFLLIDFNRGGDFFLCGNVCFFTYELAACIDKGFSFANFWWVFLLEFLLVGIFILLAKKYPDILKLGKMKGPMILYISSITLHGMMGLALMILLPGTNLALLGLGSVLFMISDYILTVDKFVIRNNKWILRSNSAFYFTGLLLIVLSMV